MSVRWHEIEVEQVDADTFTEKLPYPNTDAMGADRVPVIDFDAPVKASDLSATFVD